MTDAHASLTRPTLRGVFWLTATRAIKAPLNVLAVAVLARLLTPADFGIVAIGMLAKTLSDVLVDGSFGMVLIQRRTINSAVIGASLALSAGLAIVFAAALIGAGPYIEREFDFPRLAEVLTVLGIALPITAATTITTALLQREFRFATLTWNAFAAQLVYTAAAIGLAVAGHGLWSLVWAQVASFVVEALLGFLAVRKSYNVEISSSAIRDVVRSGGVFTVSKLLGWAANSVDRLAIGRFTGAAELGFYTRAATLMTTARQLTGTGTMRVLFPSFSKIQDDPSRMAKGYLRALSVTLVVATLVSGFMIVNAELIVAVLLGPGWSPTVLLMQILFAGFAARSGYIVAESVPLALGLGGQSAVRQGAQLVLVASGAVLGAQFSVAGAAIGICIAYWLFYLLCLILVQQLLPVKWSELLSVHLSALLLGLLPVAPALAVRLLIGADSLWLDVIPAIVFGIGSVLVLAFGSERLLGEDIVRARTHAWKTISLRLKKPR